MPLPSRDAFRHLTHEGSPAEPRSPRIGLVLGGGGLRGIAHIGVLEAIAEAGIRPSVYVGSSIGALMAAAAAGGVTTAAMRQHATEFGRRDLFSFNRWALLRQRLRSTAISEDTALRGFVSRVLPDGTFSQLNHECLVMTTDVVHGTPVVWGMPGLQDVGVRDAVYASCALPGVLPPARLRSGIYMDGGIADNLPVGAAAARGVDLIIAADVSPAPSALDQEGQIPGFATLYARASRVMMATMQARMLAAWAGPPILLITPDTGRVGTFEFGRETELIAAGRAAAIEALKGWDEVLRATTGVFPRQPVRAHVQVDRCVGCGLCAAMAPTRFRMEPSGIAAPIATTRGWSAIHDTVRQICPTRAISLIPVSPVERAGTPDLANPSSSEKTPPA